MTILLPRRKYIPVVKKLALLGEGSSSWPDGQESLGCILIYKVVIKTLAFNQFGRVIRHHKLVDKSHN